MRCSTFFFGWLQGKPGSDDLYMGKLKTASIILPLMIP